MIILRIIKIINYNNKIDNLKHPERNIPQMDIKLEK